METKDFVLGFAAGKAQGGGSGNILSGTTPPASSLGNDGDVYKQYFPIPDNIDFVEYLESSGAQYIDSEVIITEHHDLKIKVKWIANAGPCGVRTGSWGSTSRALYIGGTGSKGFSLVKSSGSLSMEDFINIVGDQNPVDLELKTLKNNSSTFGYSISVDNVLAKRITAASSLGEFSSDGTFPFFGVRVSGAAVDKATARIYRLTLFEDYVPIKDYIPCIDGNGVACMWDNVAEEYVYNDGTGDFAYGSTVTPDPLDDVYYLKENGAWHIFQQ